MLVVLKYFIHSTIQLHETKVKHKNITQNIKHITENHLEGKSPPILIS